MIYPPLVSTYVLENELYDPKLRIVDVRGKIPTTIPTREDLDHYEVYVQRHIPRSSYVSWRDALVDMPRNMQFAEQRMQVAEPESFAQAMSHLGIGAGTTVVVYDTEMSLAARFWWTLNYYGHKNVVILDGGWRKWLAEGRPVTDELPQIQPTRFQVNRDTTLRKNADQVLQTLSGTTRLLDVRARDEFLGETTFTKLAGHIPGAVNLPIGELIDSDGAFRPSDQLRRQFIKIGIDESAPSIIVYDNVGIDACLALVALHLAGIANASLYDGSWVEWGNDEQKPVEQGVPPTLAFNR
jgi:thiosulfate/3-mercaptopyruvate sulfurtransferase